MITPGEINAINTALANLRARLDAAKTEAGWGVTDWLFDVFYIGGAPREDSKGVIASGEMLLRVAVSKRNEIIEAPGAMHEEALDLVLIVNRAAGVDRAGLIRDYREATDVPSGTGDGMRQAIEKLIAVIKGAAVLAGILGVAYIISKLKGK